MSTYSGDATITDIISASASRTQADGAGTSVAYTVPAGRFAEVWLSSATISVDGVGAGGGNCDIGPYTIVDVPNGTTPTVSDSKTWEGSLAPFLINEGEVIGITFQSVSTAQSASITVRIKEYNKP